MSEPRLITLGVVAKRLGMTPGTARYYLITRGVKPIGRAGLAKVYAEADIEALAESLKR